MRRIIAIVGKPNVGKSTLFNRLAKKPKAIIDDMPGVTRDRNYADVEWDGHPFTLIDTGGFESEPEGTISRLVREQAQVAIDEADIILFLADGREGLTAADAELIELLRPIPKPVFYCLNKVDGPRQDRNLIDFYQFGIDAWHPISAKHNRAVADLMDEVVKTLPRHEAPANREALKIAVLGRPNVGKSSLVNRMLGYDRVIVSEIPGTTRDAIDTPFTFRGEKYLIIDTAGIRRKSRIGYQLEKYCVIEALRAAERSDVSIVLIDAKEGVSEQDVKIAGQVYERGKSCVLVVNKWDLLHKDNSTVGTWVKDLKDKMKFLDFAPILFVSARSGQRVTKILETAAACFREAQKRIGTGELNRFLQEAVTAHPPPRHRGREVKIYYLSQVGIKPPTFVFFTNYPHAVHFSYERYLANRLRETYGFEGTPIRLFFRGRRSARTRENTYP